MCTHNANNVTQKPGLVARMRNWFTGVREGLTTQKPCAVMPVEAAPEMATPAQSDRADVQDENVVNLIDAFIDAEQAGYHDYAQGINKPPAIYANNPELQKAWRSGWDSGAECAEIESCQWCEESNGNPCPWHG